MRVCATYHLRFGYHLTSGSDYAVAEAEESEEIFRIVLELPDDMPDKADYLVNCGDGFLRSVFGKKDQQKNIENGILAYESVVHLTPQGHSYMSERLNKLGVSLLLRFERTGEFADISDAISYQQKVVHLAPEGHASMPKWLNNLGN